MLKLLILYIPSYLPLTCALSSFSVSHFTYLCVQPLARLGASVTGIDASADLIEVAKQHASLDPSLEGRLAYIHTAAETHAVESEGKYDAVVSSEVIEHVRDKKFFLEQCVKLLKVKFVIILPNNLAVLKNFL